MFDFDIENLSELNHRINELQKTESIYNLEFVATYMEIKESLLGNDLELTFDTKMESLKVYSHLIQLYHKDGMPELDLVCKEMAFQKLMETFLFLKTRLGPGLRLSLLKSPDKFGKTQPKEDECQLKVKNKLELFLNSLKSFFELFAQPAEEARKFLSKDFFKVENVDEELRRTLGINIVEANQKPINDEVFMEASAKNELKEWMLHLLTDLPSRKNSLVDKNLDALKNAVGGHEKESNGGHFMEIEDNHNTH